MSQKFTKLADPVILDATVTALQANGFTTEVVESLAEAKTKVRALLPKGAEVFTATSKTLDDAGIAQAINEGNDYEATRLKMIELITNNGDRDQARKLAAAPSYVLGSVHAITQAGEVVVASATGSQLSAYAHGAGQVIWVVSTQKIVKDLPQAFARIREYIFPLENERSKAAYNMPSSINKELIFHKEIPGRITIVLVKERAGF